MWEDTSLYHVRKKTIIIYYITRDTRSPVQVSSNVLFEGRVSHQFIESLLTRVKFLWMGDGAGMKVRKV